MCVHLAGSNGALVPHVAHHLFIYILLVAHSVVATCRSPESAAELQQLLKEHPDRLMLTAMDVADEHSIQVCLPSSAKSRLSANVLYGCECVRAPEGAFVEQNAAEAVARRHEHLNTLLNVAGILHVPEVLAPGAILVA